jgi:hypothetical protein
MQRRYLLALAASTLLTASGLMAWSPAAPASEAKVERSNKWRIEVDGRADSDGAIVFRITPKDATATDVTVPIQKGSSENEAAKAIVSAFGLYLPKDGFKFERDDGEDVLLRKAGKTPDFALEIVSSSALNLKLKLKKE